MPGYESPGCPFNPGKPLSPSIPGCPGIPEIPECRKIFSQIHAILIKKILIRFNLDRNNK